MYLNSGTNFPTEKALGVNWDIGSDRLGFKLNLDGKLTTRHQMLSMVSKIYDPIELTALFLKRILQELCRSNFTWDGAVSDDYIVECQKWKKELHLLEYLKMERCFKLSKFGRVIGCSLHHFSDASQDGYGQVTLLRIVDEKGYITCSLVMAKSRAPPTKFVSIPRLELTAAALFIKVSTMLRRKLAIHPTIKEYFWTDSEVVLGYVSNDPKRFKIFVANRVQLIRENSDVNQWMYVDSRSNPANDASRGISPSNQGKVNRWLNSPEFLWLDKLKWTTLGNKDIPEVDQDNPEVKTILSVHITSAVNEGVMSTVQSRISSCSKLLRVTTWVMRWIKIVTKQVNKINVDDRSLTRLHVLSVEELIAAEVVVIKGSQKMDFEEEFMVLDGHRNKKLKESVSCLNPYVGEDRLIRVGGRLQQSNLDKKVMHPVMLPKKGKLTEMIIRWYHQKTVHNGRNVTLNEIRTSGYWVVQGNSAVKEVISRCFTRRRLRGKVGKQIMADLPQDRLKEEPPFTYCGVDMFGPFEIKKRRNTLKRYGALFT